MSESNAAETGITLTVSREPARNSERTQTEKTEKLVEKTWKNLMAVAQHHIAMGKLDENGQSLDGTDGREGFYQRERQMVAQLETLFGLTHGAQGYLAFLGALTRHLDNDNPVAMAFVSHVIERSALPSRETLSKASDAILNKLNNKPGRLQRMVSVLAKPYREAAKKEVIRKLILDPLIAASYVTPSLRPHRIRTKINAAIIWSFVADRHAGELCNYVWKDEVGSLLYDSLIDRQEELLVRVHALLAIEKFSITAQCKANFEELCENRGYTTREQLIALIYESEEAIARIHLLTFGENRPFCLLFSPPPGPMREEWAKYTQLKMCCQWALDHAFRDESKMVSVWNLARNRVIMNPYDATAGLKFTNNGLEIRNDRIHFESTRATACVTGGKWFYEVQLMSHGIIQVGWATSRCRFSPDEGYGVGDDCNGFAFDTYRCAVWADGVCVHPNTNRRVRCSVGDVVGSLLDLDNGSCTFYINGKDVGMTVEFESPKKNRKTERRKPLLGRPNPRSTPRPARRPPPPREVHPPNSLATDNEARARAREAAIARANEPARAEAARIEAARVVEAARVAEANRLARIAEMERAAEIARSDNVTPLNCENDQPRSVSHTNSSNTTSASDGSASNKPTKDNKVSRSRSTINCNSLAYDQRRVKRSQSTSQTETLAKKGLGLYPAISLTTSQQVRVNFGDEPWMYRPPITYAYWGINQAGELDDYYKKRVIHWAEKRGKVSHGKYFGPTNKQPLRPRYGADEIPGGQLSFSDSSDDEALQDDFDSDNEDAVSKDQCNICYSEPSNVILQPCKHGDIGSQCAAIITKCPMCRTVIKSRETKKQAT